MCSYLNLLVYSPKSSLINASPLAVQSQPNWQTSIVRETLLVLWWTYAWPLRLADCFQTAKVTTSYRNYNIVLGIPWRDWQFKFSGRMIDDLQIGYKVASGRINGTFLRYTNEKRGTMSKRKRSDSDLTNIYTSVCKHTVMVGTAYSYCLRSSTH